MTRALRVSSLMLTALALGLTSAHVLELPQKMQFDPELYAAVNSSMYLYFAIVGGAYCMGALLALGWLVYLVRRDGYAFKWTLAAFCAWILWWLSWLTLVSPINSAAAAAFISDPASLPELWAELRPRWEVGHAVGFVLQLASFSALVMSVLPPSLSQPQAVSHTAPAAPRHQPMPRG